MYDYREQGRRLVAEVATAKVTKLFEAIVDIWHGTKKGDLGRALGAAVAAVRTLDARKLSGTDVRNLRKILEEDLLPYVKRGMPSKLEGEAKTQLSVLLKALEDLASRSFSREASQTS